MKIYCDSTILVFMILAPNAVFGEILCASSEKHPTGSRNFAIFAATFLIGHLFSNRKIR